MRTNTCVCLSVPVSFASSHAHRQRYDTNGQKAKEMPKAQSHTFRVYVNLVCMTGAFSAFDSLRPAD